MSPDVVNDPWPPNRPAAAASGSETVDCDQFTDDVAATNYYAGPFCSCGDYSCPASADPAARCVNSEDPGAYTGRYPESWTDEAIEAYEAREFVESLIGEARYQARHEAHIATERINALGAVPSQAG